MRRKDGSEWGSGSGSLGQKGYGRVQDSGSVQRALGGLSPLQGWGLSWGEDDDEEGSASIVVFGIPKAKPRRFEPPLIILPLYDGQSYELEEFFHHRIQMLDAASGKSAHILDVGNPGQSGPHFRALMEQFDPDG